MLFNAQSTAKVISGRPIMMKMMTIIYIIMIIVTHEDSADRPGYNGGAGIIIIINNDMSYLKSPQWGTAD